MVISLPRLGIVAKGVIEGWRVPRRCSQFKGDASAFQDGHQVSIFDDFICENQIPKTRSSRMLYRRVLPANLID